MKTLLNNLAVANTLDELEKASKLCLDYFADASESEKQAIKIAMRNKTNQIMAQASQKQNRAERFLLDLEHKSMTVSA